jgi:uncharacterized protein YecT (DUF1311 family)
MTMRAILPALCLLSLSCGAPALAQECDRSDDSQIGMSICAGADYQAADAELTKTYGELMKRLADDAEDRKLLHAAQRAWIAFRDAECDFSTNDSKNGTIHPMLVMNCFESLTIERTKQLAAYLGCEEGDVSCPAPE